MKEKRISKRRGIWQNIIIFLAFLGPGIVTGSVENNVRGLITVPVSLALVWTLVVEGNYKIAERIFLFFSVGLLQCGEDERQK